MKTIPCSGPGGCKNRWCSDAEDYVPVKRFVEVPDNHEGPAYCSIECAAYARGIAEVGSDSGGSVAIANRVYTLDTLYCHVPKTGGGLSAPESVYTDRGDAEREAGDDQETVTLADVFERLAIIHGDV